MDRPTVGITVSLDPGARLAPGVDYVYLKRRYAAAVAAAGGLPVLLVPETGIDGALATCDALVISGGDDLPAHFLDGAVDSASRERASTSGSPTAEVAERVDFERRLIDGVLAAGRPLLGVCYGMQLLNLHGGGSLHTDLSEALSGAADHGGAGRFCEHEVRTLASHPALASLDGAQVASCHRQGVDRVAPGWEVVAEASDGVVEAIARGNVLGVEWHPEADTTSSAIYGWLIALAREARAG